MKKLLTCEQVFALINFYIQDELTQTLKKEVDLHLEKCPSCKKKIKELQKLLTQYPKKTKEASNKEYAYSLSAYMDNELTNSDNIRIKKMMITNPDLRQELETMYKFKKVLHSAFNKTKSENKIDYSKNILSKINDTNPYSTTYFYKLACLFTLLIFAIMFGFIYLYF